METRTIDLILVTLIRCRDQLVLDKVRSTASDLRSGCDAPSLRTKFLQALIDDAGTSIGLLKHELSKATDSEPIKWDNVSRE